MPQSKKPVSRLDAMAQQKGFPNYAAWKAWNEKYRSRKTKTGSAPKKNFLQSLTEKIPLHPSHLFKNVNDKAGPALKKGRKK